jgi:hypothetical protein
MPSATLAKRPVKALKLFTCGHLWQGGDEAAL